MPKETDAIKILKNSGIGVMPTDTIYGLVGSALNQKTVDRLSKAKNRPDKKPYIILIGKIDDLKNFGIDISLTEKKILSQIWPGPISVIFKTKKGGLSYLHHGSKTLAFRLPSDKNLISILKKTGPLVAPSANTSGNPPAKNIAEAKKYFGEKVDFYLSGKTKNVASTIIDFKNDKIEIIRPGAQINKINKIIKNEQ